MASISKRGDYQFQVIIRRKGYPSQTKTFETRAEAEKWARAIESKMDQGHFRDLREIEQTTLSQALDRYLKGRASLLGGTGHRQLHVRPHLFGNDRPQDQHTLQDDDYRLARTLKHKISSLVIQRQCESNAAFFGTMHMMQPRGESS